LKDIDIARKILIEEDQAMVVVKNGEVIFKSIDRGIKPMYILSTEMKDKARGASLADRVIGKGAALLCGYTEINEVYTELMSEGGMDTLKKYNIPFTMAKTCPYIKNRDKSGYCPIENMSMDIDDPVLLLEKIKVFLTSISRG